MKKRWIYLSAALMLLVGACMRTPIIGGAASADSVNLETGCSLKVSPVDTRDPEKEEYWEDMQQAQITLDLYRVAGAEEVKGYDTYRFGPEAAYGGLKISEYSDLQKLTTADWDAMAQSAAAIALNKDAPQAAVRSQEIKDAQAVISDLDAGLYLLVARGSDLQLSEYVKTVEAETEGEAAKLVTVAYSTRYEYTFTPQLIALPTKQDVNGEISTANPGPWLYDQSVYLKSGREPRFTSLEIVKTLDTYENVEGTIEPVTFVFRIVATLDGEEVYNNVASITFTEPGTGRATVDRIPATATVTVTEIYDGISYTQNVPSGSGPVVLDSIPAEPGTTNTVSFENVYNNNRTHGSGIRNEFVYNAETGEWEWNQVLPKQGGE